MKRFIYEIKKAASMFFGPRFIYGYVNTHGKLFPKTRISNTTAFFCENKLEISDNVFIGHHSVLDASHGLRIDEGCQVGFFNGIFTHSSHDAIRLYGRSFMDVKVKQSYHTGPVHIGAYSFLGAHVTVLPGTKIGRGCIVSAYSLVRGEFADGSIISGQPAKCIGNTRDVDQVLLRRSPNLESSYYLSPEVASSKDAG